MKGILHCSGEIDGFRPLIVEEETPKFLIQRRP